MQYVALFVTQYNSSLSSRVPNFRIQSQVLAERFLTEKIVYMYFIGVTEGKIEMFKNENKMRISVLIFIYTIQFTYLNTGGNVVRGNRTVMQMKSLRDHPDMSYGSNRQ